MKKIKRKVPKPTSRIPSFVIGYRGEISPPGFLAAWFDREYGGPLDIRFPQKHHLSEYSAYHTSWGVLVNPKIPSPEVQVWQSRFGWDHQEVAEVFPIANSNAELHQHLFSQSSRQPNRLKMFKFFSSKFRQPPSP